MASDDDTLAALVARAESGDAGAKAALSFAEIAAMRGVSERTTQRDWAKARLLLHRSLADN